MSSASDELRKAVLEGRVGEAVRTLYRLISASREAPEAVQAVVQGSEMVSRANVDVLLARAQGTEVTGTARALRNVQAASGGRTVLVVEHEGRRGSLRIKARDGDVGEVRFGDGSRCAVPLTALKLVCWATEESRCGCSDRSCCEDLERVCTSSGRLGQDLGGSIPGSRTRLPGTEAAAIRAVRTTGKEAPRPPVE